MKWYNFWSCKLQLFLKMKLCSVAAWSQLCVTSTWSWRGTAQSPPPPPSPAANPPPNLSRASTGCLAVTSTRLLMWRWVVVVKMAVCVNQGVCEFVYVSIHVYDMYFISYGTIYRHTLCLIIIMITNKILEKWWSVNCVQHSFLHH